MRALVLAGLVASAPLARAEEPPIGITLDEVIAATGRTPATRVTRYDVEAAESLVEAAAGRADAAAAWVDLLNAAGEDLARVNAP